MRGLMIRGLVFLGFDLLLTGLRVLHGGALRKNNFFRRRVEVLKTAKKANL